MKRQRQKPIIASGRIQLVAKLINLSPGMGTQLLSGGHQGEVVMDPADDHAEKQTKHAYNSLSTMCACAKWTRGSKTFVCERLGAKSNEI
jgi:hypothetical protein